jgi:hypothetical protein
MHFIVPVATSVAKHDLSQRRDVRRESTTTENDPGPAKGPDTV